MTRIVLSESSHAVNLNHRPKKFRPWAGKRSYGSDGDYILELSGTYTTSPMTPGRPSKRQARSDSIGYNRYGYDPWTRVMINDFLRLHPETEESDLVASLIGSRDLDSMQV